SSTIKARLFASLGIPSNCSGGLVFAPLQLNCAGMLPPLEKAELRTWICASSDPGSARLKSKPVNRIVSVFIGVSSFLTICWSRDRLMPLGGGAGVRSLGELRLRAIPPYRRCSLFVRGGQVLASPEFSLRAGQS